MDGLIPGPSRLSGRSMALIALFGASMFLVDFGPGWVLTYHEAYFAEPAREMIRTGDWLIPRVGGTPSWQKPPLTHWMIAATMTLLRTESEWAVRLPTLICTVLNALFVAAMAARWHGDRIGRIAGLIQLTTFYVLFQGRLAECDMPLCAAVSGAMLALAIGTIDRERCSIWLRLAFFTAAGLSCLIKGPFGLALIGLSAGLFAVVQRRWAVWKFLLDPLGWGIMLFLALAWPIAAYRADPSILTALRVHNLDRFTGTYDGRKDPFFYAYIIPALLLPWTPVALGGLIAGWRDPERPKALWRLMACWLVVGLALISASAWKHKHYPIPVLPPLSIAGAYGLDRLLRKRANSRMRATLAFSLVMIAGGLGTAIVAANRGLAVVATVGCLAALGGLGLFAAGRMHRAGRYGATLATLFGTVWLVVVLNESFVMPRYDLYRPHAEMARRVNAQLAPGEVLDLVEIPTPQILFYLRHPLRRFDTFAEYAESLRRDPERAGRPITIVAAAPALPKLASIGQSEVFDHANARMPTASTRLTVEPARLASANLETKRRR